MTTDTTDAATRPPFAPAEPEPSWQGDDPREPRPERQDDPFPWLNHMRAVAPVNETPIGLWRLYRYADCLRVLREIPAGVRRTDGSPGKAAMGGGGLSGEGGRFMLQQDPPNHTRLRKLVSKAFTPRAIERWRPRTREIVDALLAPALEAGEIEVMAELALPLPSQLICEMLGVPVADRELFTDWTTRGIHVLRGEFLSPDERADVQDAIGHLADYFTRLIAERRDSLTDDLLSVMIRAEEEGDRLSPDELLVQSIGLLAAGFETTVGLIGLGAKNFARFPEAARRLRDEPGRIESAVEECLRFEGPIGMTTRVLHADAEFDGRVIAKDTTVWLSIWSSNRDPAVFAEPERFDIAREPNPHLGFGGGAHLCLGAHLARMETQEALGALLQRTRALEPAFERIAWGPSLFRVPAALPMRLRAR
jgi:cytochrome P450